MKNVENADKTREYMTNKMLANSRGNKGFRFATMATVAGLTFGAISLTGCNTTLYVAAQTPDQKIAEAQARQAETEAERLANLAEFKADFGDFDSFDGKVIYNAINNGDGSYDITLPLRHGGQEVHTVRPMTITINGTEYKAHGCDVLEKTNSDDSRYVTLEGISVEHTVINRIKGTEVLPTIAKDADGNIIGKGDNVKVQYDTEQKKEPSLRDRLSSKIQQGADNTENKGVTAEVVYSER